MNTSLFSQALLEKKVELSFYEERAKKDARYEQTLKLQDTEDEVDFWNDQERYERSLQKIDNEGYKTYLRSKKVAYSQHRLNCDKKCNHGDYYELKATFYSLHEPTGPTAKASAEMNPVTVTKSPPTMASSEHK